jgi:hypothetical protein
MDEEVTYENAKCGNCQFFCRLEYKNLDVIASYGQCRRFPPVPLDAKSSTFPLTADNCLCGEWQEKE